jgi:hypothetical protein
MRKDKSGHQEIASERGTLTSCRMQREVTTTYKREFVRGAHELEGTEGQVRTPSNENERGGTDVL